MADLITRRKALTGISVALPAAGAAARVLWAFDKQRFEARLAEIDKKSGGRLGCALLNTSTGVIIGQRLNERFPMDSTFKASAAAFVLQRADRGLEKLDRPVAIPARITLGNSPITKPHAGGHLPMSELCMGAVTQSDNTAANLLLASFGGPKALTAFWRSIGDNVTRLDRPEPTLNEGTPGDPRDTAAPSATVETFRKFVLGDVLSPASREMFVKWLIDNKTGDARLRAGLPHEFKIGDKTGTGGHETSDDIAVIWPPNRKPWIVAAYLTEGSKSGDARDAILAEVGRAVAAELAAGAVR